MCLRAPLLIGWKEGLASDCIIAEGSRFLRVAYIDSAVNGRVRSHFADPRVLGMSRDILTSGGRNGVQYLAVTFQKQRAVSAKSCDFRFLPTFSPLSFPLPLMLFCHCIISV